ncbi:AraC family transcriptional regulator N-terminal domain-containing protein [Sphingomonas arantia]|uniref:AraC family transcriptional regulator N-terminal domain-containing protein n=1 Tax=Sphingomonas arantia TaxID=1460676 RepID=A0ABW4U0U3_9SPHN
MVNSSALIREMAGIVARFATNEGASPSLIGCLYFGRSSTPTNPVFQTQWPCFAMVLQGEKSVTLGDETHRYGVGQFLVVSLDLPVASRVTMAEPSKPHLGLGIAIRPHILQGLMHRLPHSAAPRATGNPLGVAVNTAGKDLLEATARLLRLLDRPNDIEALSPLVEQEILYWLLQGPTGSRLVEIATADTAGNRVARAISWLQDNYIRPFRVEELAEVASMSTSSLHHHFKRATAMTPVQFQKQLRLQAARRLMLLERLDVGSAGFAVGYQSPSQFSREYSRLYGVAPSRDLRTQLTKALADAS